MSRWIVDFLFVNEEGRVKASPYLRGNPVFGSALEMRRNPLRLLTEARRRHGDFVRFRLGPYRIQLLAHPDYVEHVLQKNPRNYLKDGYEHIKTVGNGLARQRGRFLAPAAPHDPTRVPPRPP